MIGEERMNCICDWPMDIVDGQWKCLRCGYVTVIEYGSGRVFATVIETVEYKYTIEVWINSRFAGTLVDCEMDRWIWETESTDSFGRQRRATEMDLPEEWLEGHLLGRGYECIYSLIEYGLVPPSTTFINHGPIPPRHQRSYDAF